MTPRTAPEQDQPGYPAPGSEIPGQPGFVVATCRHRVALSEWRVGLRTCERCPPGAVVDEPKQLIAFHGVVGPHVEVNFGRADGTEEYREFRCDAGTLKWRGDLIAPDGTGIRVHAVQDADECWSFAVGQLAYGTPLPPWPGRVGQHPFLEDSVRLEIDAPEGTRLVNVWPGRPGGGD